MYPTCNFIVTRQFSTKLSNCVPKIEAKREDHDKMQPYLSGYLLFDIVPVNGYLD